MELQQIIKAYQNLSEQNVPMALATVVRVHGSSYRTPGAQMLITTEGTWIGSISGGCLEGDALRKSRKIIESGIPKVITYDTRDDEGGMALGLGCNGIIDVLIEPISDQKNSPITFFEEFLGKDTPGGIALVLESEHPEFAKGARLMVTPDGDLRFLNFPENKSTGILEELRITLDNKTSHVKEIEIEGFRINIFFETIEPVIRLLIFGGGFDVKPLTFFASKLGWKVIVTDECIAHTAPALFPDATLVSHCQKEHILQKFEITPYTAAVVMSHNYAYDKEVVHQLMLNPPHYVGILGPRKRFEQMLDEFISEGIEVDKIIVDKINSPVGIDIGADNQEEIAISIIAEIKAKFRGRMGGFLKYRKAPIHDRNNKEEEILKPKYKLS